MRKLNPVVPGEYLEQALAEILAAEVAGRDRGELPAARHPASTATAASATSTRRRRAEPDDPARQPRRRGQRISGGQPGHGPVRGALSAASTSCSTSTACRSSIIELKKAGARARRPASAHAQLATYLREFPMAFRFACSPIVSDGITAPLRHAVHAVQPLLAVERRRRRRAGRSQAPTLEDGSSVIELEYLIDGMFNPERFLQLLAELRRLRRRSRRLRQADRQATPVLRGHQGGRHDRRRGREQRQGRGRLAHPGLRQVDGDGALRPPGAHATQARRTRPSSWSPTAPNGRPALRDVQPLTTAAREPGQGHHPRAAARGAGQPRDRRHLLHDAAEVRPDQGREASAGSTTRCCPTGATSS